MHNKLSDFSPKSESVSYVVKLILLSELPYWNTNPRAFIEDELNRLTASGEEIVSILPDHEDLMVILKVVK